MKPSEGVGKRSNDTWGSTFNLKQKTPDQCRAESSHGPQASGLKPKQSIFQIHWLVHGGLSWYQHWPQHIDFLLFFFFYLKWIKISFLCRAACSTLTRSASPVFSLCLIEDWPFMKTPNTDTLCTSYACQLWEHEHWPVVGWRLNISTAPPTLLATNLT